MFFLPRDLHYATEALLDKILGQISIQSKF